MIIIMFLTHARTIFRILANQRPVCFCVGGGGVKISVTTGGDGGGE